MYNNVDFILLDIAPEMAQVPADQRQRLIGYAIDQVNFGDLKIRPIAIAYLTAHMYTLSLRNGAGGNVTSEKEGDLARSYGTSMSDSPYGSTSYGQEFERLKRMFIFKPMTRNK